MEELWTRRRGRTVGRLGTENACLTLLCWFIVMIWVLVCKNMYRCERYLTHFESFYHNPISRDGFGCSQHGPHWKSFFIEIQRQGIILASVCLCKSKMWKSNVKNVFNHFPRWSEVSLIAQSLTGETHQTNLRFDVSIKHFSIVWCFM